jgi:hypothetical protein
MNLFGGLQRSATVQAEANTELLEFSQRLSATDDLVTEVTRWGLEASGIELSDEPLAPLDPKRPS